MKKKSLALFAALFMAGSFNYVQAQTPAHTVSADNSKGEVLEVKLSAKVIKIDKIMQKLYINIHKHAKNHYQQDQST